MNDEVDGPVQGTMGPAALPQEPFLGELLERLAPVGTLEPQAQPIESVLGKDAESYGHRQSACTGNLGAHASCDDEERDFVAQLLTEHGGSIGDLDVSSLDPPSALGSSEPAPPASASPNAPADASAAAYAPSDPPKHADHERSAEASAIDAGSQDAPDGAERNGGSITATLGEQHAVAAPIFDNFEGGGYDVNSYSYDGTLRQVQQQQCMRRVNSEANMGMDPATLSWQQQQQHQQELQQPPQQQKQALLSCGSDTRAKSLSEVHLFYQQAPHVHSALEQRKQRILRYRQKRRDYARPTAGGAAPRTRSNRGSATHAGKCMRH